MFRKEWLAISISKEIQLFCFGEIAVNLNQLYDQFFLANTVKKEARLFVQLKMERWETGLWCPEKCCLCSQKATSLLLTTLTEETVLASSGALYTKRREFRDLLLWWPSFIECEMGMQVSCQKNATEKNLTTALKYESLKMPFKQGKKVFKGFEFLAWKKSAEVSIISWNLNGFEAFKRMDIVFLSSKH